MSHILTAVDVFSRYAWAIPIASRSAACVGDALASILVVHGAPGILRSDNEGAFVGALMTKLRNDWGIDRILTRPYHSEANGHCERFHRYLNALLSIECAGNKKSWVDALGPTLFTYNNGVHSSRIHAILPLPRSPRRDPGYGTGTPVRAASRPFLVCGCPDREGPRSHASSVDEAGKGTEATRRCAE